MNSTARLFDAHNHLQDVWLSPHRVQVMADLVAAGVNECVVNGTCEADWHEVQALCIQPAGSSLALLPSFGLHPWDVGNRTPDWQRLLIVHLDQTPRAGVGEIGLDRWILDRAKSDDPRLTGLRRAPLEEQVEVFRWQLGLAAERNLPASIHCLDAFGALYDVLRAGPVPARGFLLHAYSGPTEMTPAFAKLGAYFSFNGAFLESRKQRLRIVYLGIPADRILVESDAPAMPLPVIGKISPSDPMPRPFTLPLSPEGHSINHPANVAIAYCALAQLRQTEPAILAAQVEQNYRAFFGE